MFNDEDPEKFKQRVEIAKFLQNTAADEMRFLKYVEGFKNEQFSCLQANQKANILEKLFTLKKNKVIADK